MTDGAIPPDPAATPSQARIYDYLLGGRNNLPVDREVADALLAHSPITRATAVENRRFLGRAVRFLVAQGISQFLDIGAAASSSPVLRALSPSWMAWASSAWPV